MIDIAPIKARLERLDAAVEDAASTGMMRITSELMGARQAFQVNAVNDVWLLLTEVEDLRTLPPGAVILDAEKNVLWRGGGFWNAIGTDRKFLRADVILPALVLYVPEGERGLSCLEPIRGRIDYLLNARGVDDRYLAHCNFLLHAKEDVIALLEEVARLKKELEQAKGKKVTSDVWELEGLPKGAIVYSSCHGACEKVDNAFGGFSWRATLHGFSLHSEEVSPARIIYVPEWGMIDGEL